MTSRYLCGLYEVIMWLRVVMCQVYGVCVKNGCVSYCRGDWNRFTIVYASLIRLKKNKNPQNICLLSRKRENREQKSTRGHFLWFVKYGIEHGNFFRPSRVSYAAVRRGVSIQDFYIYIYIYMRYFSLRCTT